MLSKVSDWVFGSFFRTIGRLLVFILLGVIISHFIDFGSIKDNFRITDLFFDKVDALSLDGTPRYQQQYNNTQVLLQDAYDTSQAIQVNFDTPFNSNADYAIFSIKGVQWYSAEDELYGDPDNPTTYRDMVLKQYLNIQLKSTSGPWAPCEIQDSYLVCGINENITYNGFAVQAKSLAITQGYSMLLNNYVWFYDKDTTSVENAINQQTQQQQQQHQQIMDSNTTQTESEASDFFSDFSVTDHGGLASILTAPLTIFNSILNDSCVPATFTYRNKEVSLPCGQTFWNQAPNVRDWLSTIESGIIAYCILISLFKLIQKLESPSNSEVEVESL